MNAKFDLFLHERGLSIVNLLLKQVKFIAVYQKLPSTNIVWHSQNHNYTRIKKYVVMLKNLQKNLEKDMFVLS